MKISDGSGGICYAHKVPAGNMSMCEDSGARSCPATFREAGMFAGLARATHTAVLGGQTVSRPAVNVSLARPQARTFTDTELAGYVCTGLVSYGVLTQGGLDALREGATEMEVRAVVGDTDTAATTAFRHYWKSLGQWLAARGGNINELSGHHLAARSGGTADLSVRAIYNDAFRDVRAYLDTPKFNVVKAISNHLRLANLFLE